MTEQEYILTHILNCSRADLYLKDFGSDGKTAEELERILSRRKKGEPLQYITGNSEFMGFNFKVDKRVLIPRPETEILVDEAVRLAKSRDGKTVNLLDVGTGSGDIAVSLAKLLPECRITAVDISSAAIEVARENAFINKVEGRIEFIVSDLFTGLNKEEHFDLIISNPPYISTQDMPLLPAEVKCEPEIALDGGEDGLDFYRRIIFQSPAYLKKDGIILMEIGYNQSKAVQDIFNNSGNFRIPQAIPDYSNIERVIIAKRN